MATLKKFVPPVEFHPGITLSEKLKEMGMSVKEFAVRTSKPEKTIFAVIGGKSSVTSEMAEALDMTNTSHAKREKSNSPRHTSGHVPFLWPR